MLRFAALISIIFGFSISNALATESPDIFLENVFAEAIEVQQISNESARLVALERLFTEHFDMARIGRFILGRNWRGLDEDQKADFTESFRKITIGRFGPMIGGASLDRFKIGRVQQDTKHQTLWTVDSTYTTTENKEVRIVWRLIEVDGSFKVFDVVAEGVSFAITYRGDYSSAFKSMGADEFLKNLRDKAGRN